MDVIREAKKDTHVVGIILTAHASLAIAIEAVRGRLLRYGNHIMWNAAENGAWWSEGASA